jgi:hypothetical protein
MRKPCCDKEGTNKGAWSKQEDQKLIDYIRTNGEGCWRSLPKAAGLSFKIITFCFLGLFSFLFSSPNQLVSCGLIRVGSLWQKL